VEGSGVQGEPAWEKIPRWSSRYGRNPGLNPSKPRSESIQTNSAAAEQPQVHTLYPPPGGVYIGVIWVKGDTLAASSNFDVIYPSLKNRGEEF
jgi:hypothetical protein